MERHFKTTLRIIFRHRVSRLWMRHSIKISISKIFIFNFLNSNMNESYNESSSVLIGEKSIDHHDTLKSGINDQQKKSQSNNVQIKKVIM